MLIIGVEHKHEVTTTGPRLWPTRPEVVTVEPKIEVVRHEVMTNGSKVWGRPQMAELAFSEFGDGHKWPSWLSVNLGMATNGRVGFQ